MCKKHRRLGVLLAIVLVGAVLVLLGREPREPVYQGRTLSAWCIQHVESRSAEEQTAAAAAIRQIGTSAFPYLLQWISYDPPRWRASLYDTVNRLAKPLGRTWLVRDRSGVLSLYAVSAFEALGPQASGAVKDLTQLLEDPARRTSATQECATRVVRALVYLGPDGVLPVMEALTNQHAIGRRAAAAWIYHAGADARPAVPLLVRCLTDSDTAVATGAANSLGELAMEPDLVVPALAASLQHPVKDVRAWSVEGLRAFGPAAQPAIPALIKALNDPDPLIREAITNTLRRLDPQSLDPLGEAGRPAGPVAPGTTP